MIKLMNKKTITTLIILSALLIALFIPVSPALAAETPKADTTTATSYQSDQHVYDDGGLLSENEKLTLEQMCLDQGKEAGIDIILLTIDEPNVKNAETLVEDFQDKLPVADRVCALIDMNTREINVQAYGKKAEAYINPSRAQKLADLMTPIVKEGKYYNAFSILIDKSAEYMKSKPQNIITNIWLQLLVSVLIGGIVVGVMAFNSGGKVTTSANTYMNPNNSGLIGRRDDYLHTHVTRVRKPQNNGGSGVSAGGRSHSTGSSNF